MTEFDVLVVGGGAAGLAGAVAIARSRRSVLVVDAGEPRNAPADGVHNLLGQEGVAPAELVARGRQELRGYGGEVREGRVDSLDRRDDGRLDATLAGGDVVVARRVLVATGLRDVLPDVPGLAEHWGRTVLHCPFCHGWEARDQRLAVIGTSAMSLHQAAMWRQITPHLTYLTHTGPDLDDDDRRPLEARGVEVVDGVVAEVESDGGTLTGVRLADGRRVALDGLVVAPRFEASAEVLEPLGLSADPFEMGGEVLGSVVRADPTTGRTDVPGVWAAGNVTDPSAQVSSSAARGVLAGAQIVMDLMTEDTEDTEAAVASVSSG